MKPKIILFGLLTIVVLVVGYLSVTHKIFGSILPASIYGISATKLKPVTLLSSSTSQLLSSRPISLPTPPPTQAACQSSGNIFSAPVTSATYDIGSYLPVNWRTSIPALPTNISLYLVSQNGGSQILFSQYSTVTNITSNGTMSVSLSQGGDAAGIIPSNVSAGQYYMEVQFTFPHGVLPGGALGSVTCSGTFTIAAVPMCIPTFGYLTQWGSQGSGNGQFWGYAIADDLFGNIYVGDVRNGRVEKFNSSGTYLSQFGSRGSGNGQFGSNGPQGIAIDLSGNIYVSDLNVQGSIARIEKFTSNGTYVSQWGTAGSGNGQFGINGSSLTIAADTSGNIYVLDSGNRRVEKFTSNGTYVSQWGTAGSGNGQFGNPLAITVDPSGNVYVVDGQNYRIEKFNSSGTYLSQFGSRGSGNGQFGTPSGSAYARAYGIATDRIGNIYLNDGDNDRIEKFTSNGTYVSQWNARVNSSGGVSGELGGITVDSNGNIYINDVTDSKVRKFGLTQCSQI